MRLNRRMARLARSAHKLVVVTRHAQERHQPPRSPAHRRPRPVGPHRPRGQVHDHNHLPVRAAPPPGVRLRRRSRTPHEPSREALQHPEAGGPALRTRHQFPTLRRETGVGSAALVFGVPDGHQRRYDARARDCAKLPELIPKGLTDVTTAPETARRSCP